MDKESNVPEARTFTVPVVVSTTATDEELFAAARKTYEGHVEPGDEPIPTVQYAIADLVYEATGDVIAGLLQLVDTPPASEGGMPVAVRRAELLIERSRLIRDQQRIANAINNGGFFPRPTGSADPPRLLALYAESNSNAETIKAIDAALSELPEAQ
jgi:hypothetical protein